ncbi:MAG: HAD hydrolase-like protein [Clostridiales bacterium]|nr:HAD hydrolase-like protein [Clostridiales bacterium]
MMFKKYIFDLDGTLINASNRLYKLFQALVPESNFSLSDYWKLKRNKVNHQKILSEYFSNCSFDVFNKKWLALIESPEYLQFDCLYDDTKRVLEILSKDNALYLLTARQSRENLLKELESLDIARYFLEILATENKTDKSELLRQIEFNKNDFFVSDMGKDIAIGNDAGLITVAIAHGFMSKECLSKYNPCFIIDELSDLLVNCNS